MLNRRRSPERGQTIVLALVFLAMFATLSVAVLTFAGAVQHQRAETESTASIDSVTEGSGQLAMADTEILGCGVVNSGSMSFGPNSAEGQTSTGDTVTFTAPPSSCHSTISTTPGQNCVLCVLSTTTPVTVSTGNWVAAGEVDINGGVSLNSLASGTRIGLYNAGSTCSAACSPASSAADGALVINTPAVTSPTLFTGSSNYVGLVITDSDSFIPPNTTITAEANGAGTATLSAKATHTATGDTLSILLNSAAPGAGCAKSATGDGALTKSSNVASSATMFSNPSSIVGDQITDQQGDIPSGTTVTGKSSSSITMSQGATASATCDTFYMWSVLTHPIQDPLAGELPIPIPGATGKVIGSVDCPGTYASITSSVTLSAWNANGCPAPPTPNTPSLFVITGSANDSFGKNSTIVGNNVTLYFSPTASANDPVDFTGGGTLLLDCGASLANPTCSSPPAPTVPSSGPYKGISVFADPGYLGTLNFQGNGNLVIDGTVEASHATLNDGGGGSCSVCSFADGRVIISQITGNGHTRFQGLVNGGPSVSSNGCTYFNDPLNGTIGGGGSQQGQILFELGCAGVGGTGVISFAFGPGP